MGKPKNYYIRFKRAELENYVAHPESCVKKIHKIEKLTFGSNVVNNFKESIQRILSRKIGKYDRSLEGVVLDFRNTKISNIHTSVRYDSAYSVINVETNFYIFQPRKDAIVDGIVKHINIQKMESIISVVIYRVFNVKVTFKGSVKQSDVHHNKEIKIRIKEFHFDNEIPYIEGEMIDSSTTQTINTRKVFDDVLDSGISESSIHNDLLANGNITDDEEYIVKQEKESSPKKHKKRKIKEEEDSFTKPPLKKIKQEPISDDDDIVQPDVIIKKELQETTEVTESSEPKKKKKKKKKRNAEDDFESSLQMILDSSLPIKKERE